MTKSLGDCIREKTSTNGFFHSIEVFPPKTEPDLHDLYRNLDAYLKEHQPLFCDITYHTHSQRQLEHPCSSLSIAKHLVKNFSTFQTVLHLTCVGHSSSQIDSLLDKAKEANIRNLFVLRGDGVQSNSSKKQQPFNNASELVSHIKARFNSHFTLCVAGYPGKHPEAKSLSEDIGYLKQKVDCGAAYIISQIVFDANEFIEFVARCRAVGILVPILPGLLPIQSAESAKHVIKFCQVKLPSEFIDFLEKNDEPARIAYSIDFFVDLCRKLLDSKFTTGLHFYTMNDFRLVKSILSKLANASESVGKGFCSVEKSNLPDTHFLFKKFE